MIRPVENADLEAIHTIYAASKLDELRFEGRKFDLLPLAADDRRRQSLMESKIFVCGEPAPIAFGAVHGDEIRGLFVHPAHRGCGLGRTLLEHLLARVDGSARLFVARSNAPAKALYERYGFSVIGEFATSYNGVPVIANEMALQRDIARLTA